MFLRSYWCLEGNANLGFLGKVAYFTTLNLAAIEGDDFYIKTNGSQGSGEQNSVVIKFTQMG